MAATEWYYTQNGEQFGPVSAAQIKQLAEAGKLKADDLVWQEGMKRWILARQVKGLFPLEAVEAAIPVDTPAEVADATGLTFERSTVAFERSREGGPRHPFDLVLDYARHHLTLGFINATARLFSRCGHYGLYAAMALGLLLAAVLAVLGKDPNVLFVALGFVAATSVLQYAAPRFVTAMERLSRITPGQVSSAALLDCWALLNMCGGLAVLLVLTVVAVRSQNYSYVMPGIAVFILAQYVAVLSLNPDALQLTVASDTTLAEEALGVLSYAVKLIVRQTPVALGVGVAWGVVELLRSAVQLFTPLQNASDALAVVQARGYLYEAEAIVVVCALLPPAVYLLLLSSHLAIELWRSLLGIPAKLDKLTRPDKD